MSARLNLIHLSWLSDCDDTIEDFCPAKVHIQI